MIIFLLLIIILLLAFKFYPRATKKILLWSAIGVVLLLIFASVGNIAAPQRPYKVIYQISQKPTETPIPTPNPNATWHKIYSFSGGNGETNTDDFVVKGRKIRVDYQTYNNVGNLTISSVAYISVMGQSNNSEIEDIDPGTYSLHINSIDQSYSIQVEDFY